MLNRITIMGRLVANPELRYTPRGHPFAPSASPVTAR